VVIVVVVVVVVVVVNNQRYVTTPMISWVARQSGVAGLRSWKEPSSNLKLLSFSHCGGGIPSLFSLSLLIIS